MEKPVLDSKIRLIFNHADHEFQATIDRPTAQIKIKRTDHPASIVPKRLGFTAHREMNEETMEPYIVYWKTMDDDTAWKLVELADTNKGIDVHHDIYTIFEEKKTRKVSSYETDAEYDLPTNIKSWRLRNYQRAGSLFLHNAFVSADRDNAHRFPIIGDEMGLGKTAQVLAVALKMRQIKSILVVCPNTLKENWKQEACTWLNTTDHSYNETDNRWVSPSRHTVSGWQMRTGLFMVVKSSMKKIKKTPIMIINYDLLKQPRMQKIFSKMFFDLVAIDEAHLIKNPDSSRAKAVFNINSRYRVAMTGTLVDKQPFDAWNILRWLYPSRYGDRLNFRKEFPKSSNGYDRLNGALRGTIMIRRLKQDVGNLPPYIRTPVYIEPDNNVKLILAQTRRAQGYKNVGMMLDKLKQMESKMLREAELAKGKPDEKIIIAKLRDEFDRICREIEVKISIPFDQMSIQRRELGIAKIPHVISHAKNILQTEDKIVIPYHHKRVGNEIEAALKKAGYNPVRIDGSTKNRMDLVKKFNTDPKCRVFLGSITATNYGINLHHGCNFMLFAERDWTISGNKQMEDRIHRDGQKFTCLAHSMLYMDSLDDRIHQLVSQKARIQYEILK